MTTAHENQSVTTDQLHAGFDFLRSVAEAIREAGQIPAGVLYTILMDKVSHDGFERMITILADAGLVRRDVNHLLTWVGPGK